MNKVKLYIMVSRDFGTSLEASIFSAQLVADRCGFYPLIKEVNRGFVVCRPYRVNDPDDEALYLSDGKELSDEESQTGWIYMEDKA